MVIRNLNVTGPSVQKWDPNLILSVYQVFLTSIILVGNGALLLFILKYRFNVMKPNLFILSLTLSDFLTGLFVTPFAHYVSHFDVSQVFCDIHQCAGQFFARISSITIMIISIDRYMKLRYPIRYKKMWSSTNVRCLFITTTWFLSGLLSLIKLLDSMTNSGNYIKGCFYRESYSTMEQYELIITVMGSNLISLVVYVRILLLVRFPLPTTVESDPIPTYDTNSSTKNHPRMNRGMDDGDDGDISTSTSPMDSLRRHIGRYTSDSTIIQSWKHTIILGSIVILNFVFVGIPPLLFSLFMICGSCVNPTAFQSSAWIFWVSCAVNPFIFAQMNPHFRSFVFSKYCPISHL